MRKVASIFSLSSEIANLSEKEKLAFDLYISEPSYLANFFSREYTPEGYHDRGLYDIDDVIDDIERNAKEDGDVDEPHIVSLLLKLQDIRKKINKNGGGYFEF